SYLIEGGPSKNHDRTKAMMYGAPELWHELMDRLAGITLAFLRLQVTAGASAVQLFDSWVGAVAPQDYQKYVLPYTKRIFDGLADLGVPRIHFGVGTGELLGLMGEAGGPARRVGRPGPPRERAPPGGAGRGAPGRPDPPVPPPPPAVAAHGARGRVAPGRGGAG